MKSIDTVNYNGKQLSVLIETLPGDENKGKATYFIDGYEITNWDKVVKRYQRLFTAMADNISEGMLITKIN
jgi:hypothetical protein